ncbi:MAG: hypothetical protein II951_07915 [Bacteroidales bacterium]|nr:hypothetical protein [Bacteroidales bacterium]
MRSLIILVFSAVLLCSMASSDCITKDGYFRGKRLCGKVRVVSCHADFKVRVVKSFADLKVRVVKSFADDPGEWEFVESFPDFTVEFVESFPDFTIEYVESFPGVTHPCR